jgi:N-dimethylarginine dimethylaminohydrolase
MSLLTPNPAVHADSPHADSPHADSPERQASPRSYLMCPPTYFCLLYEINPWMDRTVAVDPDRAVRQWEILRQTYIDLGHEVRLIAPEPDLPDMVFAANAALVVDGRVFGARFRNAERTREAPVYQAWFRGAAFESFHEPAYVNEGEGDFAVVGDMILAGTGFRTDPLAHAEAQEYFGRPVVGLQLADPRYYHLDTALFALDDSNVAYYPPAFTPSSRAVLERLFPEAVIADDADAEAFGLNSVSDGRHVVIEAAATGLTERLARHGYEPIPVNLSELRKAGGGPKCCTQEIRL